MDAQKKLTPGDRAAEITAEKRAEHSRRIQAAMRAFFAVPQNVCVLEELAKR